MLGQLNKFLYGLDETPSARDVAALVGRYCPPETRRLFEFIATLKRQGKTIIFVSHFLEDVLEVADRITVLKNSQKVTTLDALDVSKHQLVELMIGADAKILQQVYEGESGAVAARKRGDPGAVVLAVEQLSRPGRFSNISFTLRSGEILGLFGFMGIRRGRR